MVPNNTNEKSWLHYVRCPRIFQKTHVQCRDAYRGMKKHVTLCYIILRKYGFD